MQMKEKLLRRQHAGNLRALRLPHPDRIDFSSNDYLGLSKDPMSIAAYCDRLGATGSRLLTGNSSLAEQLEEEIAAFHGFEAGLLFNCGYMANLGLLSTVASEGDLIFYDAHIHASTHDGIRLSAGTSFPFRHNDVEHLEARLQKCSTAGDIFICVESIYSTDGSRAPLTEIASLAIAYGAHLIVDEAHAIGVMGPEGRGCVAQKGLTKQVFAQVCTFGKALGIQGAVVLGSNLLKQYLLNFATSFIYTTALLYPLLLAIKTAYERFPKLDERRAALYELINQFRQVYPHAPFSPIQSISIKGNEAVKQASQHLLKEGFDIRALLSPTVRRNEECLRICLHSFNTKEQLAQLLERVPCLISL